MYFQTVSQRASSIIGKEKVFGGNFTIIMDVGDDKFPHRGEYLEIDRSNKLVFA